LFGTNLSNELFEYAKAVGAETKDLKELLLRNIDAIFDEDLKPYLREKIEKYRS
jgi:predicted nucleotidyltransferase